MRDPKDPEKKQWFSKWLESKGFTNINITTDFYDIIDITADYSTVHYIFELKNRPCDSELYGDSIMDTGKYHKMIKMDGEKRLVNFFEDCFYIVDIVKDQRDIQDFYCQKSNTIAAPKVPKKLVSFQHKQENKHLYL